MTDNSGAQSSATGKPSSDTGAEDIKAALAEDVPSAAAVAASLATSSRLV